MSLRLCSKRLGLPRGIKFILAANRRFQFQKRSQLFVRVYNEALTIVTACINNADRSLLPEPGVSPRRLVSSYELALPSYNDREVTRL